ncbi:MAG: helix-turn-helix domain-containing protein [Candidatus Micrarchaeaceae archaeon]
MDRNTDEGKVFIILKRLMIDLSIDRASSDIYAKLALSEKPLTISEISKATKYSVPRTYTLIKGLIYEGLVEKEKHNRGVYYYANINFIDVFEKRRERLLKNYLEPLSKMRSEGKSDRFKEIVGYARTISKYFNRINKIRH